MVIIVLLWHYGLVGFWKLQNPLCKDRGGDDRMKFLQQYNIIEILDKHV